MSSLNLKVLIFSLVVLFQIYWPYDGAILLNAQQITKESCNDGSCDVVGLSNTVGVIDSASETSNDVTSSSEFTVGINNISNKDIVLDSNIEITDFDIASESIVKENVSNIFSTDLIKDPDNNISNDQIVNSDNERSTSINIPDGNEHTNSKISSDINNNSHPDTVVESNLDANDSIISRESIIKLADASDDSIDESLNNDHILDNSITNNSTASFASINLSDDYEHINNKSSNAIETDSELPKQSLSAVDTQTNHVKSPYDPKSEYPDISNVNWSIFSDIVAANLTESLEIIQSVPIYHYYDPIRGSYRTNAIGFRVEKVYPDLVVRIERRHTKNNKQYIYECPVIDSTLFFMHFVIAIQHAESQISKFSDTVQKIFDNVNATHQRIQDMLHTQLPYLHHILMIQSQSSGPVEDQQTSDINNYEWKSSTVLQQEIEIALSQLEILKSKYKRLLNRGNITLQQYEHLHHMKILLYDERHDDELKALESSASKLLQIETTRVDEIDKLNRQALDIQLAMDTDVLKFEYETSFGRLNATIQHAVASIRTRGEFEAQQERLLEDYHLNLLKYKEDIARKTLVASVDQLMNEFSQTISFLLSKPWDILIWLANLIFILLSVAFVYELIIAVKFMLMRFVFSKNKKIEYIRSKPMSRSAISKASMSQHGHDSYTLVLNEESNDKINHIVSLLHLATSTTSSSAVPLPNILLVGPSGVGKSMAAVAIAEQAGLPYAVLQGADLETEGSRAGWTLRELLLDATPADDATNITQTMNGKKQSSSSFYHHPHQQHNKSRNIPRPRVLIIDDASPFIRSRQKHHQINVSSSQRTDNKTSTHNKIGHHSLLHSVNGVNNHGAAETEDDIDTAAQIHVSSQSHNHNHLENCFFALLQGLRHNTINLCVILVCSSYSIESLCHVDVAILDSLPGTFERMNLVLCCVRDLMISRLSTEEERSALTEVLTLMSTAGGVQGLLAAATSLGISTSSETHSTTAMETTASSKGQSNGFRKPKKSETITANHITDVGSTNIDSNNSPAKETDETVVITKTRSQARKCNVLTTKNQNITPAISSSGSHDSDDNNHCNIKYCVMTLVTISEGWSCREIKKLMQNILSRVLSTEKCKLTTAIWVMECRQFAQQRKLVI